MVIVGDLSEARLAHAKAQGFEVADLSLDTPLREQIAVLLGEPEVDCAVDAVGFEARGYSHEGAKHESPAIVLNSLMQVARVAGKIGIPGLYVTEDPGAADVATKIGALSFPTGQTPVMKYNRALMQAIMWDRINIAKWWISLDQASGGYGEFDAGYRKNSSLIRIVLSASQGITGATAALRVGSPSVLGSTRSSGVSGCSGVGLSVFLS